MIVIGTLIIFLSDVPNSNAVSTSIPVQQKVRSSDSYRRNKELLTPKTVKCYSTTQFRIALPSFNESTRVIIPKSDLVIYQELKDFALAMRRGEEIDAKLVREIISKISDDENVLPSINKLLKGVAESIISFLTREDVLKLLAELEKPIRKVVIVDGPLARPSFFAEGFTPPLTNFRHEHGNSNSFTRSFFSGSTKLYGRRQIKDISNPHVSEKMDAPVIKKIFKSSMKNPRMLKE